MVNSNNGCKDEVYTYYRIKKSRISKQFEWCKSLNDTAVIIYEVIIVFLVFPLNINLITKCKFWPLMSVQSFLHSTFI